MHNPVYNGWVSAGIADGTKWGYNQPADIRTHNTPTYREISPPPTHLNYPGIKAQKTLLHSTHTTNSNNKYY